MASGTFLRAAVGAALLAMSVHKQHWDHRGGRPSSCTELLALAKGLVDDAALLPEAVQHTLKMATVALVMQRFEVGPAGGEGGVAGGAGAASSCCARCP